MIGDDGNGRIRTTEMCTSCTWQWVWADASVDDAMRLDVRDAVQTVVQVKPLLCGSCFGRRCRACTTPTCDCPRGPHPKRAVA
jgi:hypothetical protein